MSGNATYRLSNTSVLSVCAVEAPVVATSASFDERLAGTFERTGIAEFFISLANRIAGWSSGGAATGCT